MTSRLPRLGAFLIVAVAACAAPRALACMPACSGYHLTFTGPLGAGGSALATADRSATVTWEDPLDGPSATFDVLMSQDPVPAYPMHGFPSQLPGRVLALGLSAAAQSSWTWDTSQVRPGTYFLYAVFHNSPFNTLVMPFAAVTVSHGSPAQAPAILIRSPRGTSAAVGTVSVAFDAAATSPPEAASASAQSSRGSVVDLYVGSPPDAADGTLIASGLTAGTAETVQWDSTAAGSGSYVFKAVLRDSAGNAQAMALSPGIVEIGSTGAPVGSCQTGAGPLAWAAGMLLAGMLLRRGRGRRRAVA